MKRPHPPHLSFIKSLIKAGGEVYLVGGNVRDYFLNIKHKDHDLLVRKLSYTKLVKLLKSMGRVATVGKSFGVIKFHPKNDPEHEFDFSLPRVEKSTGPGHRDFHVDFDPGIPVEQDLARRDFSINAIAINMETDQIIDPFKGREDLEKRILRLVFHEAFVEDPLRILRGIQFAARFHLQVDPETLDLMKKNAPLIKKVSPERVIGEIGKLFMAERPSKGFDLMLETGVLDVLFPFVKKMIGVQQPMKKNEDVYQHTMKVLNASRSAEEMENQGNLEIMFAALLHDAGKPKTVGYDEEKKKTTFYGHQIVSKRIARRWLRDYKASTLGLNTDQVLTLVENHMFETKHYYSDRALRRFVNKVGKENIYKLIDLRIADKKGGRFPGSMKGVLKLKKRIQEELAKKPPFTAKDLAVSGHDIMNLGFKAGPIIGKIQKFLVEKVLDHPELNEKEKLIELVKKNFLDRITG